MISIPDIEQNPKLGYYKVGEKIFYSKPQAFIYATEVRIRPQWKFNVGTYATLNWEIEPELSIRELYRLRALQLREKYDWIRIEASGGADSTTAVYSFLLNGIHLDEVVFRYPKLGEKGVTGEVYNTKPENTLSEWQFAAQPLLQWIKTNYPTTKVTFHDYSENMIATDATRDESWVFQTRDWFQPAHADKYNQFNLAEHRILADSGKKICVLYGIEKPRMCVINDEWYVYFSDVQANSAHPIVGDYTNITNEYFYWTPDFPEITIKQAHMIKQWFDHPHNASTRYLLKWPNNSIAQRTAYEQILKPIIYPDFDQNTWQTSKPTNSFYNEMDYWFYVNFKDTKLYNAWEAGLNLLVNKIDPDYLTYQLNKPTGLMVMFSPLYYIGKSVDSHIIPAFVNNQYVDKMSGSLLAVKNKKLTTINF
jgi:hypothetical protein